MYTAFSFGAVLYTYNSVSALHFLVVPAKLTKLSPGQNVLEGSPLQLVCEATGKPAANITWTRVFKNGSESEVLHRGPSWNITNINRSDGGTYRCTADNGVANSVSDTLEVNVLCK